MLAGLSLPLLASLLPSGLLLDWLLGEARRWHPLVGFGNAAGWLEGALNKDGARFMRGLCAWSVAVLLPSALAWWVLAQLTAWSLTAACIAHAALLYFSLGLRSLRDHALPIARALAVGDLPRARLLTARIVSRDTSQAKENDVAKAGVESLLENGNDAVFGALFWFLVAGGPGALLFRLANTLDAMWGYRTPRFDAFGRTAARVDDALNFIPARLTALSYALLGNTRQAWRCWRAQAPAWSSPNAGPVMAAGAGALGILLGGAAIYHGEVEQRPPLGAGAAAEGSDIVRAWRLVSGAACLWAGTIMIAGVIHA